METKNLRSVGSRIEMEFSDGNKGTAYFCIADIAHNLLDIRQEKELAAELVKRYNNYDILIEEVNRLRNEIKSDKLTKNENTN